MHNGCILKTTILLDCALIGAYAVIRLNMVAPDEEYCKSSNYCTGIY